MPPIRLSQVLLAVAALTLAATASPTFAQQAAEQKPEEDCACKNKGNPNLLPNGEFDTTVKDATLPEHWTTASPYNVRVIDLNADFRRAVQVQGSPQQMAGDGIQLVSDPINIRMQRRYRCRGYIRSEAPRQDIIVRGYINVARVVEGRTQMVEQPVFEVRKPWKPLNEWRHFTFDFDMVPAMQNGRPTPINHIRVILASHQYGGVCWYDDVRVEATGPIPDENHPTTN